MGDHLATITCSENWVVCPFWGSLIPMWHNVAWAEAYLCTKWHLDPSSCLATIDMGRKVGGCALFWRGELGPLLTQCRLEGGLPPYEVASWSIQPFGHNRYGPKIEAAMPLWGRGSCVPIWHNVAMAEACLHARFHLDPSNCLATIHQRYRLDRQLSDSIGSPKNWTAIAVVIGTLIL